MEFTSMCNTFGIMTKTAVGWIVEAAPAGRGRPDRYFVVHPDAAAAVTLVRRSARLGNSRDVKAVGPLYESDIRNLRLRGGSVTKAY